MRAADATAAVVTAALIAAVALQVEGPVRLALALVFVTFVPGWAALGHTRLATGTSRIALAVAASLAICTATAATMVWLRAWHPFALFYGLAGAALVPLMVRAVLGPPPAPGVDERPEPARAAAAAVPRRRREPAPAATVPATSGALTLQSVSVRIAFAARAPFTAQELAGLFAAVQDRHPFAEFRRDEDAGAVMEIAGSRRLEIRRDAVDYLERAPVDIEQAGRRAIDLLERVQGQLGVGFPARPSYCLRASLAPPAGAGGPFVGFADPGVVGILGSSMPVAAGWHVTGASGSPAHSWRVTVEPDGDEGRLTVVVDADFALSDDAAGVGEHLRHIHDFLTGNVARFVQAATRPPGDER